MIKYAQLLIKRIVYTMFYKLIAPFFLTMCFLGTSHADPSNNELCETHNCKLIVDAGSSGTRAHLYAYDKDENQNPININEIYVNKIKPGFASIDPSNVNSYMTNLTEHVPNINLEVYFYATAGMRLISEEKQQLLYEKLNQWFDGQESFQLIDARTITGSEEGLFGWLATNYSLKTLNDGSEPTGFLEMGGGSTQVVFPISNLSDIDSEDIVNINVYGRKISLFAHSFLDLGATSITDKFKNSQSCFPSGYTLPDENIAAGDALLCQQEIYDSINSKHNISKIVKQAKENNPTSVWYTVGAASMISQKAPLSITNNQFSAEELLQKSNETYCQEDWGTQQSKYNNDKFLIQNCVISSFFYSLTINGYGIASNQIMHTMSDDKSSDWTIGALILEKPVEHHTEG
jgi:hypothetical protein